MNKSKVHNIKNSDHSNESIFWGKTPSKQKQKRKKNEYRLCQNYVH